MTTVPTAEPNRTTVQEASSKPAAQSTSWADLNEEHPSLLASSTQGLTSKLEAANLLHGKPEDGMDEPLMEIKSVAGLVDSVHHVKVQLADQQADPNSPLYSAKSFEELGIPELILRGIYAMKFSKPSKVQEKALPLLLSNPPQNMIAQSQSGTGKTAAFVLTMLCRVDPAMRVPQALCLCPARELARQILDVVRQMAQFTTITFGSLIKEGATPSTKDKITDHVLIGTPGTVLELQRKGQLDLKQLKVLVFDEADVMLDKQGMGVQSVRLKAVCPLQVQTLLFSATFKPEVMQFSNKVVPNPNVLTLKHEELSIDAIKQLYMRCDSFKHKLDMLSAIYGLLTLGQSIIFVHTRATAEDVYAHMTLEGHQTSVLHGGMESDARDKVIDDFRKGVTRVLITTNVLARGIDILQVSLVVNFDIPLDADHQPDPETYLHRIGRTGRFGRSGVSINFVHDDRSYKQMMAIQKFFGKPMLEVSTQNLEQLDQQLKQQQAPIVLSKDAEIENKPAST